MPIDCFDVYDVYAALVKGLTMIFIGYGSFGFKSAIQSYIASDQLQFGVYMNRRENKRNQYLQTSSDFLPV